MLGRADYPRDGERGSSMLRRHAAEIRVRKDLNECQYARRSTQHARTSIFIGKTQQGERVPATIYVMCEPLVGVFRDNKYCFEMQLPVAYPFHPPAVRCLSPIVHPNIRADGHVTMPITAEDWSPVLTINSVIYALQLLFLEASSAPMAAFDGRGGRNTPIPSASLDDSLLRRSSPTKLALASNLCVTAESEVEMSAPEDASCVHTGHAHDVHQCESSLHLPLTPPAVLLRSTRKRGLDEEHGTVHCPF